VKVHILAIDVIKPDYTLTPPVILLGGLSIDVHSRIGKAFVIDPYDPMCAETEHHQTDHLIATATVAGGWVLSRAHRAHPGF